MSDIKEEQKRLYKRAKENDLKAKMKPLFPEDVEMICISKDDYDRLYGDLTYENVELKDRINKAIEFTNQFINFKTSRIDEWENVELVLETIVSLLKGDNK